MDILFEKTNLTYVLITPARNEDQFIKQVIESICQQTVKPVQWIIVNDGSTDSTREIVLHFVEQCSWISLADMPTGRERSFASKVHCFNRGVAALDGISFDIIVNLDADITLPEDYFEFLLERFYLDTELGVAGTPFLEDDYSSIDDSYEGGTHVPGGCQLFRKECFEDIGGYVANPLGGVDWIAVTTARMKGWKTRSFAEKTFFHHRHLGTGNRNRLGAIYHYGQKDYFLGGHPAWELFRIAYRTLKRPYLLGGATLMAGYLSAAIMRMERPVSRDLIRFHRSEQMSKLYSILKAAVFFRKPQKFGTS